MVSLKAAWQAAVGLALGGLVGIASAQAGGEIHVLNWQGYGTDEAWASKPSRSRPASRWCTTTSIPSRRC